MNLEKHSADAGIIDEAVEASAITDQQNEEYIGSIQDKTKQTYNNNF